MKDHESPSASKSSRIEAEGSLSMSPAPFALEASPPDGNPGEGSAIQMKNDPSGDLGGGQEGTTMDSTTSVLSSMGQAMGADFSGVNIQTNSSEATNMGALAYAQGNDLHFAPGEFNPETATGRELIGHELAHVVQQREGRVKATGTQNGNEVNTDHGLEAEADQKGAQAAAKISGQSLGGEVESTDHSIGDFSGPAQAKYNPMATGPVQMFGMPEWASNAIDGGKAVVAFNAGMVASVLGTVWDTLSGLKDLAVQALRFVRNIITGEMFSQIKGIYNEISSMSAGDLMNEVRGMASGVSNAAGGALADFNENWNHPETWDKWYFRGKVIGSIVLEVVLALFTAGAGNATKWAGKIGKISPKLGRLLTKAIQGADNLTPDIFKRYARSVDDIDGNGGDNRAVQIAKAMAMAKALTESHDAKGSDIATLKASLKSVEGLFKIVKGHEVSRVPGKQGVYKVVQFAKKRIVDNHYTPGKKSAGTQGEKPLPPMASFEQARNKALEVLGHLGADSKPYVGTLASSKSYGKVVGRQTADGKARWRLDYDPQKGTHINIEDFRTGKGPNATKYYISFPGDEDTFVQFLRQLNR